MTRHATYIEEIMYQAMEVLRKQYRDILAENPDDIESKFTRELMVCERVSELLRNLFLACDWGDISEQRDEARLLHNKERKKRLALQKTNKELRAQIKELKSKEGPE